VMPGSRRGEVTRLLPVLHAALERVKETVIPVVPLAGQVADAVTAATSTWRRPPILVSDIGEKHDAFATASAALTKSGTSTLELALAGVPMVVAYRVNPVSAWIAGRLVLVKYASLLNLLSGREIVPELIQGAASPEKLAAALETILTKKGAAAQRAAFAAPLAMLRPPEGLPSDAAAAAVLDLIEQSARDHPGA